MIRVQIYYRKSERHSSNFSKAVTTGTRSGSRKIIYEFFDKLVTIWGGSDNTKPLQFGVQSDDYANNAGYDDSDYDNEEFIEHGGDPPVDRNERYDESSSLGNLASNFEKVTEASNTSNKKVYDNMKSVDVDSQFHEESNRKRKYKSFNKVPQLIDQKKKKI